MASVRAVEYPPEDINKLEVEIDKYTKLRDQLLGAYKQKKEDLQDAEEMQKKLSLEDNAWKDRYIQQHARNEKLEEKIDKLKLKLEELKMLESELESEGTEHKDSMANINLRRQLARLQKEEEELEWELTDYGWKVDRMAQVIYRAEEERADLLTQLGQSDFQQETTGAQR